MQLSLESGNVRSLLSNSGKHVWPDPAKIGGFRPDSGSGHIRLDPGHFGEIWPDQSRSGRINGQIRPNSGYFGQIRSKSGQPASGNGDRIPSDPVGSQPFWPNPTESVARFGRINGRIRSNMAGSIQIRPNQWPDQVKSGRILAIFARFS